MNDLKPRQHRGVLGGGQLRQLGHLGQPINTGQPDWETWEEMLKKELPWTLQVWVGVEQRLKNIQVFYKCLLNSWILWEEQLSPDQT